MDPGTCAAENTICVTRNYKECAIYYNYSALIVYD